MRKGISLARDFDGHGIRCADEIAGCELDLLAAPPRADADAFVRERALVEIDGIGFFRAERRTSAAHLAGQVKHLFEMHHLGALIARGGGSRLEVEFAAARNHRH